MLSLHRDRQLYRSFIIRNHVSPAFYMATSNYQVFTTRSVGGPYPCAEEAIIQLRRRICELYCRLPLAVICASHVLADCRNDHAGFVVVYCSFSRAVRVLYLTCCVVLEGQVSLRFSPGSQT